MVFDLARMAGVEFAIDQRMKQHFSFSQVISVVALFRHPCRSQHGAGAREARHHGTDGHRRDVGDLAVRKVLDFAQHEGFAKRLGQAAISRRTVSESWRG